MINLEFTPMYLYLFVYTCAYILLDNFCAGISNLLTSSLTFDQDSFEETTTSNIILMDH